MRNGDRKALRLMPEHMQKLSGLAILLGGVSLSEVMRQLIENAEIGPVQKTQARSRLVTSNDGNTAEINNV